MTETGGRSHRGQNHGGRKTNCTSNVSSRERKSVVGVQEVRGWNTRVPEDRASEGSSPDQKLSPFLYFYQPVFHICFSKDEHRTSNVQHPTSNLVFQLKAFSIFWTISQEQPFDVQCSMFDVGRSFSLASGPLSSVFCCSGILWL